MPSVVFGLLFDMFDRVTNAVKGVFGKHSHRKKKANLQQQHSHSKRARPPPPPTPAQLAAEAHRQRVNADQFVSNGILVETVSRAEDEDHSEAWILDVEAGTETVLPNTAIANNNTTDGSHPYHDQNRMTTVMEPLT